MGYFKVVPLADLLQLVSQHGQESRVAVGNFPVRGLDHDPQAGFFENGCKASSTLIKRLAGPFINADIAAFGNHELDSVQLIQDGLKGEIHADDRIVAWTNFKLGCARIPLWPRG